MESAPILDATWLSTFSIIKLAIAVALFSHTLPHRPRFGIRAVVCSVALIVLSAGGDALGFSVFPALTDDFSFLTAILMFAGILGVAIVAHQLLFSCSALTSLFCCSMAYLLENLSSSVERVWGDLSLGGYPPSLIEGSLRYWIIAAAVYAIAYVLLIRRIEKNGLLQISDPVMVVIAAVVVIVNMVLDLIIKDVSVPDYGLPRRYILGFTWIYVILCVYLMYSFFEIVYTRRLRLNVATIERMRVTEARQYQMSRESIEAINIKCHDLRHQIRQLGQSGTVADPRALASLSQDVDVYDSVVKTGNAALDTILTEKSLVCQQRGITLTCIADGPSLDFMDELDLYSFFGNALDNAIEAACDMDDPARRSMSILVHRAGDMVSVHVENSFDGQVTFGRDGLPRTRKGDRLSHGFGTRSMRQVAEKYGGSLTLRACEDVFSLDALIPLPA